MPGQILVAHAKKLLDYQAVCEKDGIEKERLRGHESERKKERERLAPSILPKISRNGVLSRTKNLNFFAGSFWQTGRIASRYLVLDVFDYFAGPLPHIRAASTNAGFPERKAAG